MSICKYCKQKIRSTAIREAVIFAIKINRKFRINELKDHLLKMNCIKRGKNSWTHTYTTVNRSEFFERDCLNTGYWKYIGE